jgi:hypothetical protein
VIRTRASRLVHALAQADTDGEAVEAAHALIALRPRRRLRRLERLVSDGRSAQVRAMAAYAIGFLNVAGAGSALPSALYDEDEEVRDQAADAMGELDGYGGRTRFVPALLEALDDPSPNVRYSAVYALGVIRDPSAIPRLEDLARSDDELSRYPSEARKGEPASVAENARWAIESIRAKVGEPDLSE